MSKPATKTVRYYILSAIGIAIMLFFRFLPPMGTVTELGMNVLGIFLGAIWCFSTVGTFWPALLALVLFGTSGLYEGGVTAAFTAALALGQPSSCRPSTAPRDNLQLVCGLGTP